MAIEKFLSFFGEGQLTKVEAHRFGAWLLRADWAALVKAPFDKEMLDLAQSTRISIARFKALYS